MIELLFDEHDCVMRLCMYCYNYILDSSFVLFQTPVYVPLESLFPQQTIAVGSHHHDHLQKDDLDDDDFNWDGLL